MLIDWLSTLIECFFFFQMIYFAQLSRLHTFFCCCIDFKFDGFVLPFKTPNSPDKIDFFHLESIMVNKGFCSYIYLALQ